jgi:dihydropteroate synthase
MFRGWRVRGGVIEPPQGEVRPLVIGILNTTPDSFFDGGRHATTDAAVTHGRKLLAQGADLLDVGGESTRPGAAEVSVSEEIDRTIPVIEILASSGAKVCIDTRRHEVARAALEAGACAVNDVEGLRDSAMLDLCARFSAGACAMHMRGSPADMQRQPAYADVVGEVGDFLAAAAGRWQETGLAPEALALDPGIGFGKGIGHNLSLISGTTAFRTRFPDHPWYLGLSRKSWIGALPRTESDSDRLAGSLGGALAAASAGCDLLRVHDVAATLEAWRAFHACGAAA